MMDDEINAMIDGFVRVPLDHGTSGCLQMTKRMTPWSRTDCPGAIHVYKPGDTFTLNKPVRTITEYPLRLPRLQLSSEAALGELWVLTGESHECLQDDLQGASLRQKSDNLLAARKSIFEMNENLELIQKNSRFARIKGIYDLWHGSTPIDNGRLLTEAEAVKQLKKVALQFEQGSFLTSTSNLANAHKIVVLSNRVGMGLICLAYHGQITLDFLEDQINNSPYLKRVKLSGDDWPQSVLPLVESFCLKGRPGKDVALSMAFTNIKVDTNFIIKLFNHWEVSRNLNFLLSFTEGALDLKGRAALLNHGRALGIVSTDAHSVDPVTAFGIFISLEGFKWHLKFSPANTARQSHPEEPSEVPHQGSSDLRNSEDSVNGTSRCLRTLLNICVWLVACCCSVILLTLFL
uniref:Polyprotein n=1 Tax=Steinernema glaseri TaxID=37863 RepID=A0A1I7ZDL6_9BILA